MTSNTEVTEASGLSLTATPVGGSSPPPGHDSNRPLSGVTDLATLLMAFISVSYFLASGMYFAATIDKCGLLLAAVAVGFLSWSRVKTLSQRPFPKAAIIVALGILLVTSVILQQRSLLGFIAVLALSVAMAIPASYLLTTLKLRPLWSYLASAAVLILLTLFVFLHFTDAPSPGRVPHEVVYSGGKVPDSKVRFRYQAGTMFRHFYPSDPRWYFDQASSELFAEMSRWRVWTIPGATGSLRFDVNNPHHLSVGIDAQNDFVTLNQSGLKIRFGEPFEMQFLGSSEQPCHLRAAILDESAQGKRVGPVLEVKLTKTPCAYLWNFKPPKEMPHAALEIQLRGEKGSVELADVEIQQSGEPVEHCTDASITPYSVTYQVNEQGFRDREWTPPFPERMARIACLGDSFTFGLGVHSQDAFPAVLENKLANWSRAMGPVDEYEVMNFGIPGYTVRDDVAAYKTFTRQYHPQCVILAITDRTPFEDYSIPQKSGQNASESEDIISIFTDSLNEIRDLHATCQMDNADLLVVLLQMDPKRRIPGDILAKLEPALQKAGVPVVNLSRVLHEAYTPEELTVHPTDPQPNDVVHRIVASELFRYLCDSKLLTHSAEVAPTSIKAGSTPASNQR